MHFVPDAFKATRKMHFGFSKNNEIIEEHEYNNDEIIELGKCSICHSESIGNFASFLKNKFICFDCCQQVEELVSQGGVID